MVPSSAVMTVERDIILGGNFGTIFTGQQDFRSSEMVGFKKPGTLVAFDTKLCQICSSSTSLAPSMCIQTSISVISSTTYGGNEGDVEHRLE